MAEPTERHSPADRSLGREPPARPSVCGVRFARGGPVKFASVSGEELNPGQRVVVDAGGAEILASVVFASRQLLASEIGITPVCSVLRLATDQELAHWDEEPTARTRALADALPASWPEWLAAPAEEPRVRLDLDDAAPLAAEVIERVFPTVTDRPRGPEASGRRAARPRTAESPGRPGGE